MHDCEATLTARPVQDLTGRGLVEFWPVVAILAAVLLWGSSFAAMRVAVAVLPPATMMWLRMLTAALVLTPFLPALLRALRRSYRGGDWRLLLPMVLLQPCLYFLLESNALQLTTSSQAGVISASVPLLVTLGAWLFLHEHVRGGTFVGLGVAAAGVVVLSLTGGESEGASAPLLGNLMELGAMACAAGNLLLVKRLCCRYSPWGLTALQVLAGLLFFSPGILPLLGADSAPLAALTGGVALPLTMLYLGSCVSLGAFSFFNWGMSRMGAGRAAASINLVPVAAVTLGWLLLGEALTPVQLLAACAVLWGVWKSQNR